MKGDLLGRSPSYLLHLASVFTSFMPVTLLRFIFLSSILFFLSTETAPLLGQSTRDLGEYYQFITRIAQDDAPKRILALREYVRERNILGYAYEKLFEHYLAEGQLQAAKECFTELRTTNPFAEWMLARIFALEQNTLRAHESYSRAIRAVSWPTSGAILRDFASFALRSSNELAGPDSIELELENQERLFLAALADIHTSVRKQTEDKLNLLLASFPGNLLLMHYRGVCAFESGNKSLADSIWQAGLQIARRRKDKENETLFLSDLGILALRRDPSQALAYLQEAGAIAKQTIDLDRQQFITGHKGIAFAKQDSTRRALKLYQTAIDVARKLNNYADLSLWLLEKGNAQVQLGNYPAALDTYHEGEDYAIKAHKYKRQVELNINMGNILRKFNMLGLARRKFERAASIADDHNLLREKKKALSRMADVYVSEGNYRRAQEIYISIIASFRDTARPIDIVYWNWRLGYTCHRQDNYEDALKYLQQALQGAQAIESSYFVAWSLLQIAAVQAERGRLDEAVKLYRDQQISAVADKDAEIRLDQNLGLGVCYEQQSKLDSAIAAFRRAVAASELTMKDLGIEQLRIGFFSKASGSYRHLSRCYFKKYKHERSSDALDSLIVFEELSRARTLLDRNISRSGMNQPQGQTPGLAESYETASSLAALQRAIRLNTADFDSVKLISLRYALLEERLNAGRKLLDEPGHRRSGAQTLSAIAEHLDRQETGLIQYHISDSLSFAIVIARGQTEAVTLPASAPDLQAAVDSLVEPFYEVDASSKAHVPYHAGIAHRLYRLLFEPVSRRVALPGRLIIVPDLTIMTLPLELLLVKPQPSDKYTPQDFPDYKDDLLVQMHEFAYSPSTFTITNHTPRDSQITHMLVFADPNNGDTFTDVSEITNIDSAATTLTTLRKVSHFRPQPLLFAGREVKKIKEIFPQARIFDGDAATEENFLHHVSESQIIHFATHAFADLDFHDFSGLVLSPGPAATDDGILMGYEIRDLSLHCELVSLSACETARGKTVAGEGVLALPRLLLAADVKSVLTTHWQVDDRFASELMPLFYKNYLKDGAAKTTALSEAKRTILAQKKSGQKVYYQHPFFWAAFVLFGDPGANNGTSYPGMPGYVTLALGLITLSAIVIIIVQRRNGK